MMALMERNECHQVSKLSILQPGEQIMLELTRLHGIKHETLQDCSNQQISYIARLMSAYGINSTQIKEGIAHQQQKNTF